jgi:hypothetical protein
MIPSHRIMPDVGHFVVCSEKLCHKIGPWSLGMKLLRTRKVDISRDTDL